MAPSEEASSSDAVLARVSQPQANLEAVTESWEQKLATLQATIHEDVQQSVHNTMLAMQQSLQQNLQQSMQELSKKLQDSFGSFQGHMPKQTPPHSDSQHGDKSFKGSEPQTRNFCLEFPTFEGEDPAGWISNAQQFFEFDEVPPSAQPYKQLSTAARGNAKLSPRFYGPFRVFRRVGTVAYELDLPAKSRIHPVFHVSQLKPRLGSNSTALPKLPPVDANGLIRPEPLQVLSRQISRLHNRPCTELLIHWTGQAEADATWEEYQSLRDAFPHLVGKVCLMEVVVSRADLEETHHETETKESLVSSAL